jgi:hypothetical protein
MIAPHSSDSATAFSAELFPASNDAPRACAFNPIAKEIAPNLTNFREISAETDRSGQLLKHYAFENAAVRLAGVDASREFLEPMFGHRDRELLVVASATTTFGWCGS